MSDAWANKADYDEDRAHDQLLREEYAKIKAGGPPPLFEVTPLDPWRPPKIRLAIAGLGEIALSIDQARQLGSALLAEVEIATRGDLDG